MGTTLTRRSRRSGSCCMASMTVYVAVLMMSISVITVQANSQLKDDEIEAFLNRVNKPAVKSIVLEDGDIVDCVDIYKQPAFDHPLLKNYTIKMPPSSFPKMAKIANASRVRPVLQPILQTGKECPKGTVPIRRTMKSDLIHAKSLDGYGRRDAVPGWKMAERSGLVVSGNYIGAVGSVNVWPVAVESNEWSHADLELSDDSQKSFIEGGSLVNPSVFGDNKTRLYAYWTADGYGDTGCYNMLCPGFIQISQKVVLGAAIWPLSDFDGMQYEIMVLMIKDDQMNVWWLVVEWEYVGFWPIHIFVNNRFVQATTIKWLGGVLNTNNGGQHTTTDMGSGRFASEGYLKSAFIRNTQVMKDRKEGFDFPEPSSYFSFADNPKCYGVDYVDAAYVLYYGGPGLGADGC